MDTNRQAFWDRSNQLVIVPVSATNLKQLNNEIKQAMLSLTPFKGCASSVSKISDCFNVLDIEREQCHMIFVHQVDFRSGYQSSIGKVVKFSKSCFAPYRAKEIRLATPTYYRDEESLPSGIADRYDSTMRMNASRWARDRFSNDSTKAEVVFSSLSEPWVYCTSHFPSNCISRDLKARFSDKYDYDATTELKDVNAFAMWLGIDVAIQIDKVKHLNLEVFDTWVYSASSYSTDLWQQKEAMNIDTFIHVYHGPVHYEDVSGVISSDEDWSDIHGTVRAWFTKRMEFSYQSEYRFVVTTPGTPRDQVLKINVSDDLRQIMLAK